MQIIASQYLGMQFFFFFSFLYEIIFLVLLIDTPAAGPIGTNLSCHVATVNPVFDAAASASPSGPPGHPGPGTGQFRTKV